MATLDELIGGFKEDREWAKAHPFKAFPGKVRDFVWYRIPGIYSEMRSEVVWGFQRMFRGFDDRMVWGYEYENAKMTVAALRKLLETKHGAPFVLDPDNVLTIKEPKSIGADDSFFRRWDEALQLIIDGFEARIKMNEVFLTDADGNYDHVASMRERGRLMAVWNKGATLFIANYGSLWD